MNIVAWRPLDCSYIRKKISDGYTALRERGAQTAFSAEQRE